MYLLFFATLIAVMTALMFRSSTKREKGINVDAGFGGSDTSYIKVIYLMIVYPAFVFIAYLVMREFEDNGVLEEFFSFICALTFVSVVYYSVLLIAYEKIREKFSAHTCVALCIVPTTAGYIGCVFYLFDDRKMILSSLLKFEISSSVFYVLFVIWLVGFAWVLTFKIARHNMFCIWMKKNSFEVENHPLNDIWKSECEKIKFEEKVVLKWSDKVSTPITVGLGVADRIAYFPQGEYTEEQLRMICQHEIRHVQRRDVMSKFGLEMILAMQWFNPIVWKAVAKAEEEMELACDEIVLEGKDAAARNVYAKLILKSAGKVTGFSTCLSDRADGLRYRLKEIVNPRERKRGTWLLLVCCFIFVMSFGVINIVVV